MIESDFPTRDIFASLYMVRHGESTCNTVNRIAGCLDAPLTFLGRSQAIEASRAHHNARFDRVYVSPLSRAYHTAEIIAGAHGKEGCVLAVEERLVERDFGDYTLENKSLLQRKHGVTEYERAMNNNSPTMGGGESFQVFHSRVLQFFEQELLPALARGEQVLVVSHKYVIELICRMILKKPPELAYDLRLPNSQIIRGDRIESYIKNESKWKNIFYDWMVVNHPLIFCLAVVGGLFANYAGLKVNVPEALLLSMLLIATSVTMCRIELESAASYLKDAVTIRQALLRYVLIPIAAIGSISLFNGQNEESLRIGAMILAAPAAISALTVSRCLGGLVMPSLAFVTWSSVLAVVPTALLFAVFPGGDVVGSIATTAVVSIGSILFPFLAVRAFRYRLPIRTAKFGERYAHTAVIVLALFIFLSSLRLELADAWKYGITATAAVVALRLLAALIARNVGINALDAYASMSYPNVFVVIIIAGLIGNNEVQQVATWLLFPLFALSVFDGWYARWLALSVADRRLLQVLGVAKADVFTDPNERAQNGI
jgi:broad specificity phosphatase PhoE